MEKPFWKTKTLDEMNNEEWESLCDGCGLCCLNKLEDWDSGDVVFTSVRCQLMDGETCRCVDYPNRQDTIPDCIQLTPNEVREIPWLPPSCAYRLVRDGLDLYWWHPLVSGDPETVVAAGVSVRGRVFANEDEVPEEEVAERIVNWPLRWPRAARGKGA